MDYHKCAQEIYDLVGRQENIVSAAHCATRLRLVIRDNKKVELEKLENVDGVLGVFSSDGQLQIIIGTGTVNKVYDEFIALSHTDAVSKEDMKASVTASQPILMRILKAVGDVFYPILPAIVAAGLMMGLVEALGRFVPAFAESDIYLWMDLVSNTAIKYLPVLVAISTAHVFGGSIFLGATIGMLLMHRDLLSAWTAAADPSQIEYWNIACFHIRQVDYQGHILPIIIAIWLMCILEKWLHKHVPEMIDLFVTPLITLVVTAFFTMSIIGPVFIVVENNVLTVVRMLLGIPFGIGAFICGAFYPLIVVCGIHHMFNVFEAGMIVDNGRNIFIPVTCSSNVAMCTACIAVFVKTKNVKTKSLALPAGISAALGITEPAIFGINLRYVKPLICGMIGGAFGAAAGTIMGVYGSSYGVSVIPGFLITTNCTLQYTIMLLIAGTISFLLTCIVWKEEKPAGEENMISGKIRSLAGKPMQEKNKAAAQRQSRETDCTGREKQTEEADKAEENKQIEENKQEEVKKMDIETSSEEKKEVTSADQGPALSWEKGTILCPIKGQVVPNTEIPDETFSAGYLGNGAGIEPEEGIVIAPCDGEISVVADTKHAIGITSPEGMEILIHIGLGTVTMDGKGFEPMAAAGDAVKAGQVIMKFSLDEIKKAGHPAITAVLLTNSDDFENFKLVKTGQAERGETIATI